MHQKVTGSVRGDFIYSFRKVDLSQVDVIDFATHSEYVEQLVYGAATRYLAQVGRATTSELYRHIYQALIPFFVQYAQARNQGKGKDELASVEELFESQLDTMLKRRCNYVEDDGNAYWELPDEGIHYEQVVVEAAHEALKTKSLITVDDVHQRIYQRFAGDLLIDVSGRSDTFSTDLIENILRRSYRFIEEDRRWRLPATPEEEERLRRDRETYGERAMNRLLNALRDGRPAGVHNSKSVAAWVRHCTEHERWKDVLLLFPLLNRSDFTAEEWFELQNYHHFAVQQGDKEAEKVERQRTRQSKVQMEVLAFDEGKDENL